MGPMKSGTSAKDYPTPTAALLEVSEGDVTFYPPDSDEMPDPLWDVYDGCIRVMDIETPPTVAVVKDEAWEKIAPDGSDDRVEGYAIEPYNTVVIRKSVADLILKDSSLGGYSFCHEMGHIKQYQEGLAIPISRRALLASSGVGFIAAGIASAMGARKLAPKVTDNVIAQGFLSEGALVVGGAAGATATYFSFAYYESLRKRAAEFYADKMAIKVLGAEILPMLVHLYHSPLDGASLDAVEVDKARAAITQRYGSLLDEQSVERLSQAAVTRKLDFENEQQVRHAATKRGYPKGFDRIVYLLEDEIQQRQAATGKAR